MSTRFDSIKPENIFKQKSKSKVKSKVKSNNQKTDPGHTPFKTKKAEEYSEQKSSEKQKITPKFEFNNELFPSLDDTVVVTTSVPNLVATPDIYIKQQNIRNNPEYDQPSSINMNEDSLEETNGWLIYKKINGKWFESIDENEIGSNSDSTIDITYHNFVQAQMTKLVNRWEYEEEQKRELYGPDYSAIYPWEDDPSID
jgi:hypothetical protein